MFHFCLVKKLFSKSNYQLLEKRISHCVLYNQTLKELLLVFFDEQQAQVQICFYNNIESQLNKTDCTFSNISGNKNIMQIIPALMMLIVCNFQAVYLQFLGNQPHINVGLTVWLDLLCRETQLQEYLQSSSPTTLSQSPLMSLLQTRLQRFKTIYLLSSQTISSFKQIILVLKVFLMSVRIHSLKHSLLTQLLNFTLIIKL